MADGPTGGQDQIHSSLRLLVRTKSVLNISDKNVLLTKVFHNPQKSKLGKLCSQFFPSFEEDYKDILLYHITIF